MSSTQSIATVLAYLPLGGVEIILILALVLILLGAGRLPPLARRFGKDFSSGFKRGVQHHLDEPGKDPRFHRPNYSGEPTERRRIKTSWAVFAAQGFGVGLIPVAPGTFGTVAGLIWFVLLLLPGSFLGFVVGILVGIALSVWLCGQAETLLEEHDPPSVVLDEIVAAPICFVPWVASAWLQRGVMPGPASFFTSQALGWTVVVFALFRAFDILKPWPVGSSQRLPGGWGITVDDVLAAGYVALLTIPFLGWRA